jgi:hypothetical protein
MTLIFLRYVPESVRWLLAKRKNRNAGKIVKKAAQANGVVLSDRLISAFDGDNTKPRKVGGIQAGHWTDLSVPTSTDFMSALEESLP